VQAGVQVERELGAGTSASIGYVHLAGRGIMMSINQNVPTLTAAQAAALGIANLGRPDSRVANNTQYQSIGISRYDGLTMSLRADRTRWGSLRVSYTLGRALDDTGNNFFNQPQDAKNVLGDWGRSDNDQRHHLTVSGSTPAIAAERGAARLLRGFQLSAVFSYASAPPFNVQTGADRNGDTNVNDRPAGVARNTGVGFDTATLDLRLSRSLAIVGRHRLELSVDVFNVLNRTNFLTPNNIFGTGVAPLPAFGRPTQAADPRELQFGVRWSF
jgi:hypothetical protein